MKKQLLFCSLALASSMTAFANVGDPVADLSQLSNGKVYVVSAADETRGSWCYDANNPAHITSTPQTGATLGDVNDVNQQFAFIKPENSTNYYIYNVASGKFLSHSGNFANLVDKVVPSSISKIINSTHTDKANYPWVVVLDNIAINLCKANDNRGVVLWGSEQEGYQANDGGNSVKIVEAGDFDSKEALDKIAEFEKIYTEENLTNAEALNTEVSGFLSVPQYAVGGYDPQLWQNLYDACGGDGVVDIYDYAYNATEIKNCITALQNSSPTEFSNEKVYKLVNIVSSNGYLYSKQEDVFHVYSSAKSSDLTTVLNSDKWQLYTQDGRSFLYNQGTKRFAKYDSGSNTWVLSDDPTYLTVTENTNKRIAAFSIKDTETSSGIPYMHCSMGYKEGVVGWNADPDASYFYFEEVEGTAVDLSTYYASKLKCDEANSYLEVPANSVGGYSKDLLDALNTACGGDGVANIADLENEGFDAAINALKSATPIAFSNDKVYKIQNLVSSNGYLISKVEEGQTRVYSSAKKSDLETIENSDKWQLWTMQDGQIRMLYNQGTGKFIKYDQPNNQWVLQDEPTIVNVGHNENKGLVAYWIQDPDYTGQFQYLHVNVGQDDATGVKGWETTADASNFCFVEVDGAIAKELGDYELSYLKGIAQEMVDNYDGESYQTYVGAFKTDDFNALKAALAKDNVTFAELKAAIGAAREGTKPKVGQYYWMRSVMTFADGHVKGIYENPDNNNIAWSTPSEEAKELWMIEDAGDGKYYIKSVNTGKYITQSGAKFKMASNATTGLTMIPKAKTYNLGLQAFDGVDYTMSMSDRDAAYTYAPKSATEGGYVVSYNGYGQDIPTQWNIIEATSVNLTIGETGYATAYFPFAVTIPEGVKAYTVSAAADGVATLSPLTGTIPANTGVVLSGSAKTYPFAITTSTASAVEDNLLNGVTIATDLDPETSYILANGANGLGFYKVDPTDTKLAANKAYLNNANGSFFSLKLDGAVTGIQSVENAAENAPAYDLQGRRLPQVPTKGLYIQNGKKIMK